MKKITSTKDTIIRTTVGDMIRLKAGEVRMVPERVLPAAFTAGCYPVEDTVVDTTNEKELQNDNATLASVLEEYIATGNYKPSLKELTEKCGFTVSSAQRDEILKELTRGN